MTSVVRRWSQREAVLHVPMREPTFKAALEAIIAVILWQICKSKSQKQVIAQYGSCWGFVEKQKIIFHQPTVLFHKKLEHMSHLGFNKLACSLCYILDRQKEEK